MSEKKSGGAAKDRESRRERVNGAILGGGQWERRKSRDESKKNMNEEAKKGDAAHGCRIAG
jgi:hypothetical protein